jgi:hypothetical protein
MLLISGWLFTGRICGQTDDGLRVRVSAGYDRQDLHWSIAGNSAGQDPNIYSELKWQGLSGPSGAVDLEWSRGRWRAFAGGTLAFTHWGVMTDADYGLNNRNDQLYYQQFPLNRGYTEAVAAGIGYCLLDRGPFRVTSFIGYGLDGQYLPVNDINGLNSNYSTLWQGPLVKAEASWRLTRRWEALADVSYQQLWYRATADWNLIDAFAHPVSFRDRADGYGVGVGGGLRYLAGGRWAVELCGGYSGRVTGTGIDQLYLASGKTDETQLNEVSMSEWNVRLGLSLSLGRRPR